MRKKQDAKVKSALQMYSYIIGVTRVMSQELHDIRDHFVDTHLTTVGKSHQRDMINNFMLASLQALRDKDIRAGELAVSYGVTLEQLDEAIEQCNETLGIDEDFDIYGDDEIQALFDKAKR